MAANIRTQSLDFPIDIVTKCPGFALDIGGSVVKFVYRSKEDWEKAKANKDAKTCPMRLLTCGRPDLDAALAIVKEEAYISREEGKATKVYSCGVGGYQMNDKLKEALDIDLENVQEADCMMEGMDFLLKTVPQQEVVYPLLTDIETAVITQEKAMIELWLKMSKKMKHQFVDDAPTITYPEEFPLSSKKSMSDELGDALYPLVILQLGSAYGFMQLNKDGPPQFCDMSVNGGRHFMGMASLLTGVKSYDEFIDLAEKGDLTKVSQTMKSLAKPDDEGNDDPYADMAEIKNDNVIFAMGHAVFQDRDKFKREDVAQAWLVAHIHDVVHTIHHIAAANGVKDFYVGGSFANRKFVREHMVRELTKRDCQMVMAYKKQFLPRLLFMKDGGHTGAVGALINSVQKFTKDREAST